MLNVCQFLAILFNKAKAFGILILRLLMRLVLWNQWKFDHDMIIADMKDGSSIKIAEVWTVEGSNFKRIKLNWKWIRFHISLNVIFGMYEFGYITDEEMHDFWTNKDFDYEALNKKVDERIREHA